MSRQDNPERPNDVPPELAMLQMIHGAWVSQAICVAAKLGVADLLKDGSRSATNLAKTLGVDALSLYRVLRMLASEGDRTFS